MGYAILDNRTGTLSHTGATPEDSLDSWSEDVNVFDSYDPVTKSLKLDLQVVECEQALIDYIEDNMQDAEKGEYIVGSPYRLDPNRAPPPAPASPPVSIATQHIGQIFHSINSNLSQGQVKNVTVDGRPLGSMMESEPAEEPERDDKPKTASERFQELFGDEG